MGAKLGRKDDVIASVGRDASGHGDLSDVDVRSHE